MIIRILRFFLVTATLLFCKDLVAQKQGRVVINEYMNWPSSGCGVNTEFIELLNFGPGPVDVSCYILTTGVYAITLPKNTVLQPGEFFVLAGQDFIPSSCANSDSSSAGVHAQLNWNTCHCLNKPVTGNDGLLTDGGNANTPLVLLDPSLNIVDAVVRNTPTEAVQTITSASLSGACPPKTFNIGTMNPKYEVLGMSMGRGNSFIRTLDGDCAWLKEAQPSANATNNRSGGVSAASYEFNMVRATSCPETGKGSVSIYVKASNAESLFPMTYTLLQDTNGNGVFDLSDGYRVDTAYTPPFVEINDLPVGKFRVTVGTSQGCDLKTFDFSVIPCAPAALAVRLAYFRNKGRMGDHVQLEWLLQDVQNLQSVVLEKAGTDGQYSSDRVFSAEGSRGEKLYSANIPVSTPFQFYRLKLTQKDGNTYYSSVI
ncbi:MAG TPA: lamin tail domain-containing protein, partial [Flavisolibacter sp.]|nr:lamin tail domain-containing protein [Flavisolibacter sp.]